MLEYITFFVFVGAMGIILFVGAARIIRYFGRLGVNFLATGPTNHLSGSDGSASPPNQESSPAEAESPLSRREALIISGAAAAAAFFYALNFSGRGVEPQLSFALFCPTFFIILAVTLKYMGLFKNSCALFLLAPIVVVSSFNAVFTDTFFVYGNVVVALGLFALFLITAVNQRHPPGMFSRGGMKRLSQAVVGDWKAWISLVKTLAVEGERGIISEAGRKTLRGALLAVPVLVILTALLMSADMVFLKLGRDFLYSLTSSTSSFDRDSAMFAITLTIAWVYFCGYIAQSRRLDSITIDQPTERPQVDLLVSATFLGLVNILFLAFSWVQLAYLFKGGFMTLPPGITYAKYAREGFFQLLLVTVINFSLILFFLSCLKGARESRPLRFLLFCLCLFTGVLIASSFYRIFLYVETYGHTVMRLRVITFLSLEVFWVLIAAASLLSPRIPIGRSFLAAGFVFYLIGNITGSYYFATKLNLNLFLTDRLEYLDAHARTVGLDGLKLIRPIMEDGHYICQGYKIIKADPAAKAQNLHCFEDIVPLSLLERASEKWQNWSYFKSTFIDSIDIEQYKRSRADRVAQAEEERKASADRVARTKEEKRARAEKAEKEREAQAAQAEQERKTRAEQVEKRRKALADLNALAEEEQKGRIITQPDESLCVFPHLEIPPEAKVYAAGAYAGEKLSWQLEQSWHNGTLFRVVVNSPEVPVLLMLGAYEPSVWQIGWTADTRIIAVLVTGIYSQFVNGLPNEVPVLISTQAQKGPCRSFYGTSSEADFKSINDLSLRLFGRSPEAVLTSDQGYVLVGRPLEPEKKVFTAKALVRENFEKLYTPQPGLDGLDEAVSRGLIRPAEPADFEEWNKTRMEAEKRKALASNLSEHLWTKKKEADYAPESESQAAFVVLRPEFVIPNGLLRYLSTTFIVPAGFPAPQGSIAHCTILMVADGSCRGLLCRDGK